MRMLRLKQWTGLALVGAILAGCGSSGPSAEELIAKYKLNEADQAAFKACDQTLGQVKPIIKVSSQDKMMSSVPSEICACQAKSMSSVFVEDEYTSFSNLSGYLARLDKKKLPRIAKQDLKSGIQPDSAAKRLLKSFEMCTSKYLAEIKDPAELKDLLLPPPAPKKTKKQLQDEKKKAKDKENAEKLKKQAAAG